MLTHISNTHDLKHGHRLYSKALQILHLPEVKVKCYISLGCAETVSSVGKITPHFLDRKDPVNQHGPQLYQIPHYEQVDCTEFISYSVVEINE